MSFETSGLVALFERVRDGAAEQRIAMLNRLVDYYGDKPYGFTDTDVDTRLEYFLTVQATPGAWEQMLAMKAQTDGLPLAEMNLMAEVTHLNRLLINRGAGRVVTVDEINEMDDTTRQMLIGMGADVVYQAQFEKRLGRTAQTIKRLEKLEAMPKAHIYIPPPRPQLGDILGMGDIAPQPEMAPTPVDMGMGTLPAPPMTLPQEMGVAA